MPSSSSLAAPTEAGFELVVERAVSRTSRVCRPRSVPVRRCPDRQRWREADSATDTDGQLTAGNPPPLAPDSVVPGRGAPGRITVDGHAVVGAQSDET